MKRSSLFFVALILAFATAWGISACGGELDSCPGIVCSDCGGFGDCNVTCDAGQTEFCGAFGFFDDPGLRCAWCSDDPDPFNSRVSGRSPTEP
jgi:hypothetical protein